MERVERKPYVVGGHRRRQEPLILLLGALLLAAASPELLADLIEVRSIDGSGNNTLRPLAGAANTRLIRFSYDPFYPDDGTGETIILPPDRPNARDISNRVGAQNGRIQNGRSLSDFIWQWGQFITHDIDLTQTDPANGTAHITINDPNDPMALAGFIPFNRSNFDPSTSKVEDNVVLARQQINQVTSFIDASQVYGSDQIRADTLRTFSGGKLKMSSGNLLSFNTGGLPNDNNGPIPDSRLFLAGDVRANEQVGLTAMHTIFAREHNRLTELIDNSTAFNLPTDPTLRDIQIYETARKIVGAEMQMITYNEFLPAFLGDRAPNPERFRYRVSEDPDITQTFAHALFRFGHSMNSPSLELRDTDGSQAGTLELRNAFFNPDFFNPAQSGDPGNVDRILMGMAGQLAEENDIKFVDEVRNFLFGPPEAGGIDLAALDIQRGRDHGLPSYNETRRSYGVTEVTSVTDITSDPEIQQALIYLYDLDSNPGNIENIDLFVGAMAEDHLPGTSVGVTIAAVVGNQFLRLRDGDRFFYLNDRDLYDDNGVRRSDIASVIDLDFLTLSHVIQFNTDITNIQDNVFFVPEPTAGLILTVGGGLALTRRRRGTAGFNSR